MKNPFRKFRDYIAVSLLCRYWSYYLEEVANNAYTTPRNKYDQEIEDVMLNSILMVSDSLEDIDPAAIAVLSPVIRQKTARELVIKFRDKKFIKQFLRDREG